MKASILAAALMLPFAASSALAQERAGDAALGALSGAVVLGPIGAVAGAVVGYTAGPSISRSWGMRHDTTRRTKRSAASSGRAVPRQVAQGSPVGAKRVAQNPAPAPRAGAPAAAAAPAPASAPAATSMPPVQGFD